MIKFLSIQKLKDMWEEHNNKKNNKPKEDNIKSIEEKSNSNHEETSNNNHEEYLEILANAHHDAAEKVWKELENRRKNMAKNIQESSVESSKNLPSDEVPTLKIPEEKANDFSLDIEQTSKETSSETTSATNSESKVETKSSPNLEALINDLISQVSELKKEISILKSSKQISGNTMAHTIQQSTLRPEDDEDLFIRQRHRKYTEDTNKVSNKVVSNDTTIPLSSIESSCEPCSDKVTKKVEDIPTNISNNLEILEEKSQKSMSENDIFTDDLPDLEKVPGEIVLNSLLNGSKETIKILDSYVENNHVKTVKYTENIRSVDNFYISNNKAYFLSLEQWAILYDIISESKNLAVLRKTVKKNPYMVYTLKTGIESSILNIKRNHSNIFTELDTDLLCKIILKSLNYILINHYEKDKLSNNLEISYANLCKILGDNVGNAYIEKFIYQTQGPLIQAKNTRKKVSLYTHTQIEPTVLSNFIEKIQNGSISMEEYVSVFNLNVKDKSLFEYLNASILFLALEENSITCPDNEEIILKKESLKLIRDTFVIPLVNCVIDTLVDNKILKKEINKDKVPYISLNEKVEIELYSSATFYKPSLIKQSITTAFRHELDSNMSITLDTDKRKIKHSNNTHLKATPKLKEILNNSSTYTIATNELTQFVQYTLEILNKDFSINDADILNFLWIYQLDFREIIINIKDDILIERLMRYALDLDTYHSKSVLQSVDNNGSALAIYNKVTAKYKTVVTKRICLLHVLCQMYP